MKESGVIRIKEHPKLMREAALWFHEKWGEVPVSAYFESMKESLSGETSVPGWYLYITGGSIAAGAGVIENDFHDRKDLAPNICSLYVSPKVRCTGIAGKLLDEVCRDVLAEGIEKIYLVTEHENFYERYGWEFLCMAMEDGGGDIRVYVKNIKDESKNELD